MKEVGSLAHSDTPPLPSRAEVEAKLIDLIEGQCSREEVASWASPWVRAADLDVEDLALWDALENLCGADLKTMDRPYLHGETDFRAWLEELRHA
jgi:hypothetical protein